MKKCLFITVLFLFPTAFMAQSIIGPDTAYYKIQVQKTTESPVSSGLLYGNRELNLGRS